MIVIILNIAYILTAIYFLIESGNLLPENEYPVKRPKLSPYKISKMRFITKDEFGHRFKIDIDSEFCKGK